MHGSVTLKYDEPEVENVTREHSPSATFSTEGYHISMLHEQPFLICFVVWATTSLKYDFLVLSTIRRTRVASVQLRLPGGAVTYSICIQL